MSSRLDQSQDSPHWDQHKVITLPENNVVVVPAEIELATAAQPEFREEREQREEKEPREERLDERVEEKKRTKEAPEPKKPAGTPWWRRLLNAIGKYLYYYIGYIFLFIHLPKYSHGLFKYRCFDIIWLVVHICIYIYCYTLPFVFVLVSFGTLNTFGIYLSLIFFLHVNLLLANRILKEKNKNFSHIFKCGDKVFSWFRNKNLKPKSVKKKIEETKTDVEMFCLSYYSKTDASKSSPPEFEENTKFVEVRNPSPADPIIEEVVNLPDLGQNEETSKVIVRGFNQVFLLVLAVRMSCLIGFLSAHYKSIQHQGIPYQVWLTLGIFATCYLEAVFVRNMDLVGQIVFIKRMRRLISLKQKYAGKTKINMSCPISLMTWTKVLRNIQKTGLDHISKEDIINSLYLIWIGVIVVVVIADKIFRFDHTLINHDILIIYAIDIFTLTYQIIVRLYYGLQLNNQLVKTQVQVQWLQKYFKDLNGYYRPLIAFDIEEVKYDNNQTLLTSLKHSFREEFRVTEVAMKDKLDVLNKTMDIVMQEMQDLNLNDCYQFLGCVPCNTTFFVSLTVTLLTTAGSAFFSEIWEHSDGNTSSTI